MLLALHGAMDWPAVGIQERSSPDAAEPVRAVVRVPPGEYGHSLGRAGDARGEDIGKLI
jgi:hypothetical protein